MRLLATVQMNFSEISCLFWSFSSSSARFIAVGPEPVFMYWAKPLEFVVDGVAPIDVALEHVTAEERGRQIAARVNAQRTTPAPQQPKTENPK